MNQVCCVLGQVVDGLDDMSLALHDLVIEGHKPVLHVGFQSRDDVCPVLGKEVEELG